MTGVGRKEKGRERQRERQRQSRLVFDQTMGLHSLGKLTHKSNHQRYCELKRLTESRDPRELSLFSVFLSLSLFLSVSLFFLDVINI